MLLEERCIVISGPSGVGKTTLVGAVLQRESGWMQCITCTTRAPREGEVDGKDYYFLSEEEFMRRVHRGDLLEYAEVYDNLYGSPRSEIERAAGAGKRLMIVVDTVGCLSIRARHPQVKLLGILPPNMGTLYERLLARGKDSPEQIRRRLAEAYIELTRMRAFDFTIVNDDLDMAVGDLQQVLALMSRGSHLSHSRVEQLQHELHESKEQF